MSRRESRIAVGSCGSSTGFGVLSALAAWPGPMTLLACDTNPKHLVAAATKFDFVQMPQADDEGFAADAAKIFAGKGVTVFYPIHDAEIAESAAQVNVFAAQGITVLTPASDAVAIVRDKLRMAEVFAGKGVRGPISTRLDRAEWTGVPLHFKPRCGVGSHGVGILPDARALADRQARDDAVDIVVQPFLEGQEITIDVFCPRPGEVLACCCRERLEVKAGVSTKARLFKDAALRSLAGDVSQALGLVGSFCFQVRGWQDRDEWSVIDVNPRVGGGTAMSVAAGMNFPAAHAALFLNHDPEQFFDALPDGDVFVTRSFREHVAWP